MPTTAEEPAIDAEEIDLFDYFQVVWSYRWLIVLGTLGAMAVAGALSLALPKTYQASMLLKVGTLFVPGEGGGPSLIESPKTVVQVLSGDAMALKLRDALGRRDGTPTGLKGAVTAKLIKNDGDAQANGLVEVTLRLDNPQQVMEGLQFLAGDVIAQHRIPYEAALSILDRRVQNVESRLRAHEAERDRLQAKLVVLKQRLDGGAPARSSTDQERAVSEMQRRGWEADLFETDSRLAAAAQRALDLQSESIQLASYRVRSENTMVRSAPVLPGEPVGPRTLRHLALAGMLGLMASVLAAFLVDYVRGARRRRLSRDLFPR